MCNRVFVPVVEFSLKTVFVIIPGVYEGLKLELLSITFKSFYSYNEYRLHTEVTSYN